MTAQLPRPWADGVDLLAGGDIILFGGEGFLSDGIKAMTRSPVSHSAIVFPPELAPAGSPVCITESTILGNRNGPQLNTIESRLEEDPIVWVARLSPRVRSFIDWPAVWALALKKMGHDKYSVAQIAEYLLRKAPLINDLPVLYRSVPGEEVCSEYLAQLLAEGGLPGLNPATMPPQKLAEMKIYSDLFQLRGKPTSIPRFNTV